MAGPGTVSRTDFHPLTVVRVDPLTDDSAALTFGVPPGVAERFRFAPGQSLTVRRGAQRRSYSICAPQGHAPRIGVREVAGGAVSSWLVHEVRPGDVIDVQVPSGTFTPDLSRPGHHVLIAAGSGITPVLSIAGSVLAAHPGSAVTLIYGNRRSDSVMFTEEIADLKDTYPARLCLVHVLSREPQEVDLFNGRPRPRQAARAAAGHRRRPGRGPLVAVRPPRHGHRRDRGPHRPGCPPQPDPPGAALCRGHSPGPGPARGSAGRAGRRGDRPAGRPQHPAVTVPPWHPHPGRAAQRIRPDLPFACKGGVCGTCRALVTKGQVTMRRNYALEQDEVDAGYALTCQALPVSDQITVDYDA